MLRVGIVGATGYSGLELVRLLLSHPQAKVTYVSSRSYAGKDLNEVFPALKGRFSLKLEDYSLDRALEAADFLFYALPHGLSEDLVPKAVKAGRKVIDIGSDFRLDDLSQYEAWYKRKAVPRPADLKPVYGLPELNGDKVRGAQLVANPGCYPTATLLGLAPLVEKKLVDVSTIIVDAKSGVTGAGRSLSLSTHYCEVNENLEAYKVAAHQHTPEVEQELSKLTAEKVVLNLTTHLVPMSRGIMATCYARLGERKSTKELLDLYRAYYLEEPFVQVLPEGVYPATKDVYGSNTCMIGLKVDERVNTVIVLSVIDNLTKGAAGQAIQNMNLMCGFEETLGLPKVGVIP